MVEFYTQYKVKGAISERNFNLIDTLQHLIPNSNSIQISVNE